MRLFYAIEFDRTVKDSLCAAMDKMKPCFIQGRFTPRENLHLTLVFLGEISGTRLTEACAAMDSVSAKRFSLCIGGVGFFRQTNSNLCWAGVETGEQLQTLYTSLCAELRERGFRTGTSPYRPHLTLVRQAILQEGCNRRSLTVPVIRVPVEQFSLIKSELGGRKPVYTVLHTKELES